MNLYTFQKRDAITAQSTSVRKSINPRSAFLVWKTLGWMIARGSSSVRQEKLYIGTEITSRRGMATLPHHIGRQKEHVQVAICALNA